MARNTRKTTCYVVGAFCFLPHPSGTSSLWVRADRCVAFTGCPVCEAPPGERCAGATGAVAYTHAERRKKYTREANERHDIHTTIVIEEIPR